MVNTQGMDRKLHRQCWQQVINLISGECFSFKEEYCSSLNTFLDWHHIHMEVVPPFLDACASPGATEQYFQIPIATRDLLKKQLMRIRVQSLAKLEVQKKLSSALYHENIQHLFFKGLVLSKWLYAEAFLNRESRDIDLIISWENLDKALSCLYAAGFKRLTPKPSLGISSDKRYRAAMKDMTFIDPESGVLIELHWRLREYAGAFQFDFNEAYQNRKTLRIGESGIPCFDDITHTRYFAMHGCHSYWGRLRWVCDWKAVMSSLDGSDLEKAFEISLSRGENTYMALACLMASAQINADIPDFIEYDDNVISRYWLNHLTQSQQQNRYPNWGCKKALKAIALNKPSKIMGDLSALIQKGLAADTLR